MTYKPFGAATYYLGSSISSTQTTILLSSFLEPVTGVPYTMALLDTDIVYATIGPKTSSAEFISFTGITQNDDGTATLTGVVRGLAKKDPFTTDSDYKLPHAGQSIFIISDAPQLFNKYMVNENDETVSGLKTFEQFPVGPSAEPTDDYQLANKKYIDDVAIAGAPNASTTVKGIVEEATQAEADARTTTGGTGARLFVNPSSLRIVLISDYVIDTGSANAYAIAPTPVITGYTAGQIFSFKAIHANTTASTLAVSGLSTKTIKNSVGGDLVANDILVGQLVVVEYDGTNLQMLSNSGRGSVGMSGAETIAGVKTFSSSPVAPTPSGATDVVIKSYVDGNPITSTNGVTTYAANTSSGAQTIAHGLGRAPKKVRIIALLSNGSLNVGQLAISHGVYNGSTNSCVYSYATNSGNQGSGTSSSVGVFVQQVGAGNQSGVITFDATNITITWTYTATLSGTIQLMWEAQ